MSTLNEVAVQQDHMTAASFTSFVERVEPRLRRALVGAVGAAEAGDATAEALAWAWANKERISQLSAPVAFLFRVGQSRSRRRMPPPTFPEPVAIGLPEIEPRLVPALLQLTERQRVAVWLVHACDWTYDEAAQAMDLTATSVGTHVSRGLARLRHILEDPHA